MKTQHKRIWITAFAIGFAFLPQAASADWKDERKDVWEAKQDVREEAEDLQEAFRVLQSEQRQGDRSGVRNAWKNIREEKKELREANYKLHEEQRDLGIYFKPKDPHRAPRPRGYYGYHSGYGNGPRWNYGNGYGKPRNSDCNSNSYGAWNRRR